MQRVGITGTVISGQHIRVEGFYSTSGDWRPITVNASGELPISVSVTATADISGQAVWVGSGEVISKISGEVVNISGQPVSVTISEVSVTSGEIHILSGNVNIDTPSTIRIGNTVTVGSISGGITVSSGSVKSVTLKSLSSNSGDLYIGGYPYSGFGLLLEVGEAICLDINNLNLIRVYAVVSGDHISYMGIG